MDIYQFWQDVLSQNRGSLKKYFHTNASVKWHNTNEYFNVEEFIQANCEYPNHWDGKIERLERIDDLIITAVHVFSVDQTLSFHVVSFIKVKDNKIVSIDEYWGDDGVAPQWRLDKHIGKPIQE